MSHVLEGIPKETKNAVLLSDGIRTALNYASDQLNGDCRRLFMAETVCALGEGGQRVAEKKLGWNRGTIRKGIHELQSGLHCIGNLSARGRKPIEYHLTELREDIREIVKPSCQADPTFRTTKMYTPLTAKTVRTRLIEEKGYTDQELPTIRTISDKLNDLKFYPQKVSKCKPIKKIKETDEIFRQVFKINEETDSCTCSLRLSMDAKAKVNVGPFSRGGKSRQGEKASDHDFGPEKVLTPFGIFLPLYDESFLYFTESKVTADFIVDCLEKLWPSLKEQYLPDVLVLNLDNGPENNSHRTQFIKRIVDFAETNMVKIKLAYYPPYHSKYNPIERLWGILENHWNGEVLDTEEKILGLASTMTYNGINPSIELIGGVYQSGIKLNKEEMASYERKIIRHPGLERWFVDIPAIRES